MFKNFRGLFAKKGFVEKGVGWTLKPFQKYVFIIRVHSMNTFRQPQPQRQYQN